MARYVVILSACDGQTEAVIDASPSEFAFLETVKRAINAESDHCCMPILSVREADAEVIDGQLGEPETEVSTTTTKEEQ